MGKALGWVISVIVVAAIIVGGYFVLHKSPAKNTNTSNQNKTSASLHKNTSTDSNKSAPSQQTAVNNSVVTTKNSTSIGQYLADPNGNTLYTDGSSPSNCTGACLSSWPAYQDKGATTGLPSGIGTVKRPDNGQIQFTYKGLPLYYFTGDNNGQVTGNGIAGFSVARP